MNIKSHGRAVTGSLTLAAVIASVLGTASAVADDQASAAAGGLEEVVVTATRREESLQDVPLAVTAITADSLSRANITNLGDLQAGRVPGFVPTRFSGGSTLAISVRGIGISDPTQGTTELTVPVYIDGVFLGRGQGLGIDLIDPERVEILRGPQGQLFGRNAEGGVVQYVSRKPSGEFGVRASGSFGNYNDQRIKATIDLPAVFGISTQFSGMIANHDPYTEMNRNSTYPAGSAPKSPNYGHNLLDSSGGRFAARWNNDGPLTVDYTYDYSDEFSTEGYLTWMDLDVVRPATSSQPESTTFPDKTHERLFNRGFQVLTSGHNLTLNYELNDSMTFKSITAYRETSRHGSNTLGAALPAGVSSSGFIYTYGFEDLAQNQKSEELQFIGTWDQFDLTVGAMYFNEKIDKDFRRSDLTGPGLIGPVSFILPGALQFCVDLGLDPCPTTSTLSVSETKSYGIYTQGNYRPSFLPGLELTVGLRYTDDQKDAMRKEANGAVVNIPAEFSASRVDPAGVIKYNWTDNLQTYFRYATGYRAGGANVRSSNFTSFDEEENEALELGLKSVLFDNHLRTNVSLFQNTLKGEQLTIQEAPTTNPSLTNTFNGNDRKIKGAELELAWAVTDTFSVGGNYAYMDTPKWAEYDNPFTATVGDIARFYTVSTPRNSGAAFVDWNGDKMFFRADYSFAKGNYWLTPGAVSVASMGPTYERPQADMENVSARLGWHFDEGDEGKFTVALWGNNLSNNASIVYGFDGCAFGGGFCAFRTAPRTYGVEVKFEY